MDYPGNLFVVAAPSGAGKSSLVRALLQRDGGIRASVSHTTRAPRGQEADGVEYWFVGAAEFDAMVARGDFLEWAHVHGNRYGTSRSAIERSMADGHDVVLEIDVQGALAIQALFTNAVTVFILPPSPEELRVRLTGRGEDAPEVIELRLKNAAAEMAQAGKFDFVIINSSFEAAVHDLGTVVSAQRLRYTSQRRARADVFKALQIDSSAPGTPQGTTKHHGTHHR